MAAKIRKKVPDAKLAIEATRAFNIDKPDKIPEKLSSASPPSNIVSRTQTINSKPPIPTQIPSHASSNSPKSRGILETILSQHPRLPGYSGYPKLQNRPRTVSSLKNKKEVFESSNEAQTKSDRQNDEVNNDFTPLCVTMSCKKDNITVGEYELGNEIGKGAYGTVRLGVSCASGEKVAIKIYEKAGLSNPNKRKSVEREIKILSKLKHKNIIRLISTVENMSTINLIFEYVSGCSLLDYLKSRSSRKIEEYQAKCIFKQILEALDYCHNLGITHRDIKLENILLDEDHTIKLIDFGFATYIASDKKVQLFCGTSRYMAPEIVSHKESLGPPTDIWSAGVVLYVLITGTFPFKAPQTRELYSKIQRGIYTIPPTVSISVRDIIKSIFEINPNNRPTAKELLASEWMNAGIDKTISYKTRNLVGIIPLFNKTFC